MEIIVATKWHNAVSGFNSLAHWKNKGLPGKAPIIEVF